MGLWHNPRWDSFKLAVRGRIHAHNLLLTCWTPVVQIRERLFDLWNGIDTAGRQPFDDLTLRGSDGSDAGGYGPVRPRDFRRALSSLEIDHRQYCFVDFGSGKGRAILMASRYPFKKIIGIEFAKELHEAALINLRSRRWRKKCGSIELFWADALEFDLPEEPCVLFFANPFGEARLRGVLEKAQRSIENYPRSVIVVYFQGAHESVVESLRNVRLLSRSQYYHYATYQISG